MTTVDQYQVHANAITGEWITEPVFVGKVDLAEWNKLPYTERYAHSTYEVPGEDGTTITRAIKVIWDTEAPPEATRPSTTYKEHRSIDAHGFNVTDATSMDPHHGHDDVIWIGTQDAGLWITPDRAREVAAAIISVADSHDKRRGKQTKGEPA